MLPVLLLIVLIVVIAVWGLNGLGVVAAIVGGTILGLFLLALFAVWYVKRKVRREVRRWGMVFGAAAAQSARKQREDVIDVEGRPHERQ
ncbi:MAG: hypothetical protein QOD77_183 [Thermoplasmata archaeon]|jgi:peptidoglycan/LPS O-acetylase OafA/YrhL|nr:hypothetical protein [Thermoplasmata archaeon]